MKFFQRILQKPVPPPPAPSPSAPKARPVIVERRRASRFAISPEFPLKAGLRLVARDEAGEPMSQSREGWNWKGHLIDFSENGARMQLGPGVKAHVGDTCDLLLSVGDFELTVPCHIRNISDDREATVFGLRQDIAEPATLGAYQQLLEVVALGSTLKPLRKLAKPDESGYFVEQYANDRPARLTVWREPEYKSVGAFEFLLKDSLVRASTSTDAEYLAGTDGNTARPAPSAKAHEIHRLFRWVVPNLAACVPKDVRRFLGRFA